MSLTISDFQPLVGQSFDVPRYDNGEVHTTLTLRKVDSIGNAHPHRSEPFSLVFDGPSESALDQGTFILRHSGLGDHDIFLVPVSEANGTRQYQAIFN